MLWRYAQHLFHSVGELCLARGGADAALAYAGECLSGAEVSGSLKNIVKARRLRGQALVAQGELAAADADPRGRSRPADGRDAYREAVQIVSDVAARLPDERLRHTLLSSSRSGKSWTA